MSLNGSTATRVTAGVATAGAERRVQTMSATTISSSAAAAATNARPSRRGCIGLETDAAGCSGAVRFPVQRVAEPLFELADAAIPARRVAVERALDDADETLGHVGPQVAQRLTESSRVCARQLLHRRGGNGKLAGDEVEEHHADAVEIALDRGFLPAENLRRQIERRSDEAVAAGELLAGAEVHEDDAAAGLAHDVLRLDVAVQEACSVDGGERGTDVQADEGGLARTERPAGLYELLERFAANELGPEPDAAVVLLGAVDLHDVLVAETGEAPRLVHQPRGRVAAILGMEQLQRDVAVELGVPGAEHIARRALADELEKDQAAPSPAVRRRSGDCRCVDLGRGNAAMQGGDAVDETEMTKEPPIAGRSTGFSRLPVDRAAVRYRGSEIRERTIISPQLA